jgi:uncharacterized protein YjbI with pentapeptide repeats
MADPGSAIISLTSEQITTLTLGGALGVGLLGIVLLSGRHRDLGVGLLSGATIGLAIFALQLLNEDVAKRAQKQQQRAAKRETVQLAIATTSNLSGFDPRGESLVKAYLVAKTLNGAKFNGVDLTRAELRDTQIHGALLNDATLSGANLINAELKDADLAKADLSGAQLQDAEFQGAKIFRVESLKGAKVNLDTCWPPGFLDGPSTQHLVEQLIPVKIDSGGRYEEPSTGHTCDESDEAD